MQLKRGDRAVPFLWLFCQREEIRPVSLGMEWPVYCSGAKQKNVDVERDLYLFINSRGVLFKKQVDINLCFDLTWIVNNSMLNLNNSDVSFFFFCIFFSLALAALLGLSTFRFHTQSFLSLSETDILILTLFLYWFSICYNIIVVIVQVKIC